MWKWFKRGFVSLVAVVVLGFVVFGTDAYSYVTSSGRALKEAVKDSVPVEFEIKRARDLLEELLPELHANLKLIAREEVEVATLENDLERERNSLDVEEVKIDALRDRLSEEHVSYNIGRRSYGRGELIEHLNRSFEQYRTAELLFKSKEKLLETRNRSLDAAIKKLEKMRITRLELAAQIETLEGQFRLVQAESATSKFQIDNSKLAQTHRLLTELRKRLEVTQRVLARESRFVDELTLEELDEESVLSKVDAHFESRKEAELDTSL